VWQNLSGAYDHDVLAKFRACHLPPTLSGGSAAADIESRSGQSNQSNADTDHEMLDSDCGSSLDDSVGRADAEIDENKGRSTQRMTAKAHAVLCRVSESNYALAARLRGMAEDAIALSRVRSSYHSFEYAHAMRAKYFGRHALRRGSEEADIEFIAGLTAQSSEEHAQAVMQRCSGKNSVRVLRAEAASAEIHGTFGN